MMTYRFYVKTRTAAHQVNLCLQNQFTWKAATIGYYAEMSPKDHYKAAKSGIDGISPYSPIGDEGDEAS